MAATPLSVRSLSLAKLAGELSAILDAESDVELPASTRDRAADLVERMRLQLRRKPERDPRSLFDIDDRLAELMERAVDESAENGMPEGLCQEINDYLEAFRGKVDRIAGYWRWQESIAEICGKEASRLIVRKRAAEARVERLKAMLQAFMEMRGFAKLEGELSTIGLQPNSNASLVVDDPARIGGEFWERSIRFNKTEASAILNELRTACLRRMFEGLLESDGWEINSTALRLQVANNASPGARLVKRNHVRLR